MSPSTDLLSEDYSHLLYNFQTAHLRCKYIPTWLWPKWYRYKLFFPDRWQHKSIAIKNSRQCSKVRLYTATLSSIEGESRILNGSWPWRRKSHSKEKTDFFWAEEINIWCMVVKREKFKMPYFPWRCNCQFNWCKYLN